VRAGRAVQPTREQTAAGRREVDTTLVATMLKAASIKATASGRKPLGQQRSSSLGRGGMHRQGTGLDVLDAYLGVEKPAKEEEKKKKPENPLVEIFQEKAIINDELLEMLCNLDDDKKTDKKVRTYDAPTAAFAGKTEETATPQNVSKAQAMDEEQKRRREYYIRMKKLQGQAVHNAIPDDFLNCLSHDVDALVYRSMQDSLRARRPLRMREDDSEADAVLEEMAAAGTAVSSTAQRRTSTSSPARRMSSIPLWPDSAPATPARGRVGSVQMERLRLPMAPPADFEASTEADSTVCTPSSPSRSPITQERRASRSISMERRATLLLSPSHLGSEACTLMSPSRMGPSRSAKYQKATSERPWPSARSQREEEPRAMFDMRFARTEPARARSEPPQRRVPQRRPSYIPGEAAPPAPREPTFPGIPVSEAPSPASRNPFFSGVSSSKEKDSKDSGGELSLKYRQHAAEMHVSESVPDPVSLLPPGENRQLLSRSRETLLENLVDLQEVVSKAMRDNCETSTTADQNSEADSFLSVGTLEDVTCHEAIWRLRKYLRKRYGNARKAWAALENACMCVTGVEEDIIVPRMADTLKHEDITVGLSRMGIRLPAVAGYGNVRKILNTIDKDQSGYMTMKEFLGDEEADPSLAVNTPPPEKESWQVSLKQPRWHGRTRLDGGMFDDKLRKTVCQRECFRDMQPSIISTRPVLWRSRSEERPPLWSRSVDKHRTKMALREELEAVRSMREIDGCTFQPHRQAADKYKAPSPNSSKSYSRRVIEERERTKRNESKEMTFQPKVNDRSMALARLNAKSLETWYVRLSNPKEMRDNKMRMGRLANSMADASQAEIRPKPDVSKPEVEQIKEKYQLHESDERPAHVRLFHSFPNEFWNMDEALEIKFDCHKRDDVADSQEDAKRERPKPTHELLRSSSPEAQIRRWEDLRALNAANFVKRETAPSPTSTATTRTPRTPKATQWTPSSIGFPDSPEYIASSLVPKKRETLPDPGELEVEYKDKWNGMIQAIRRYGEGGPITMTEQPEDADFEQSRRGSGFWRWRDEQERASLVALDRRLSAALMSPPADASNLGGSREPSPSGGNEEPSSPVKEDVSKTKRKTQGPAKVSKGEKSAGEAEQQPLGDAEKQPPSDAQQQQAAPEDAAPAPKMAATKSITKTEAAKAKAKPKAAGRGKALLKLASGTAMGNPMGRAVKDKGMRPMTKKSVSANQAPQTPSAST